MTHASLVRNYFSPQRILRSGLVTLFALFSLFGPPAQAWEGAQCGEFLLEVHMRGGVALSTDEARLYDIGARGVLRVMYKDRFSAEEKIKLWRAAVEKYREREPFVNDEMWFEFRGEKVVAFAGAATEKLKTLLFILPDGKVYLTYTPDYLQTLIERKGGGLQGVLEGTATGVIETDPFLEEYLGSILMFARGEKL